MRANNVPLTASEIGNLWSVYQEQTMIMRFLEHFLEHVEDKKAKHILSSSHDQSAQCVESIINIFQQEGIAIPVGFTKNDVHKGAPKLFDFEFETMFLYLISKIEVNFFALYSGMSYRKDIRNLFKQLTANAQETLYDCVEYLLEKGILARPPYMSMPKEATFVKNHHYLTGFNLLREKRSLNAIEISLVHHAVETNLIGMQLMMGFAQVANDQEVRDYFVKGMKLSKDVETTFGEYLRQDYIEPPATHAGKATDSTVAPFSDKMMMYLTNWLGNFGFVRNALGGAFSLRSDLPMTMARVTLKIFRFSKEGGQIMINHGWMEEPPQVEDRQKLTK